MEQSKHIITFDGRTQSLAAWARELGLAYNSLYVRIRRHGIEKALAMPKQPNRKYVCDWRFRKTEAAA